MPKQCFNLIIRKLTFFGCFLGLRLLFPNPSITFDTMRNRILRPMRLDIIKIL